MNRPKDWRPLLVKQIGRVLQQLKAQRFTVLLIEQNFNFASTISDWHYLVENGQIVDSISNDEARQNTERVRKHMGI